MIKETSVLKKVVRSKSFPLILVLAAVLLLFYLIKPAYLSMNNIRNIMNACSLTGIIAVGMGVLLIKAQMLTCRPQPSACSAALFWRF